MENRDETVSLISAGKVQGTSVYNTNGDSLGEVYAIMSFGGFLGVGERYHLCRGITSNTTPATAVT
jgi:hypothetical protein